MAREIYGDVVETGPRGPLIARAALWLLALAIILTGIILTANGGIEVWTSAGGDSYDVDVIDVRGIGIALLCTGIVVLAATLIAELFLPTRARLLVPESARLSLRLHDKD